jgi:hypothetical protein
VYEHGCVPLGSHMSPPSGPTQPSQQNDPVERAAKTTGKYAVVAAIVGDRRCLRSARLVLVFVNSKRFVRKFNDPDSYVADGQSFAKPVGLSDLAADHYPARVAIEYRA